MTRSSRRRIGLVAFTRWSFHFGMRLGLPFLLAALIGAIGAPAPALAGACKLSRLAEIPITMSNLRPVVTANINGTDVRFIVDSGAFYSIISAARAAELNLTTHAAPAGFSVSGIGGSVRVSFAQVKELSVNGIPLRLHGVEFIVGGSEVGADAIGVLGRNLLQIADAEYDLGRGIARLMTAEDCGDALLAYWLHPGDVYSVINISKPREELTLGSRLVKRAQFKEPIIGNVYVNGVEMSAIFDTGASTSVLTVKGAARAGIKLDSPGVVSAEWGRGIGRGEVRAYLAPVSSFKIGDEEVRNSRLRLAETGLPDGVDMLIGADFFLSHHIYVANSQHKLYFSYNGGPVFNLQPVFGASQTPSPGAAPGAAVPEGRDAAAGAGSVVASEPAPATQSSAAASPEPSATQGSKNADDAADYARRGEAFASRREFDQALPALTRACELAPDNPEYFYQRGEIYSELKQQKLALADFDRTLQLKASHVLALLARADARFRAGDKPGAQADLDSASAALPKQDALRANIAASYAKLGMLPQAIDQSSLWIASHPEDVGLPGLLNFRCRARALGDIDLKLALEDCDQALKHAMKSSPLFAAVSDSRGLVWLRLGNYDKSISDYDAALRIAPKDAWSLYGRGIAKLRAKNAADGQADITQAKAISPEIADKFGKYGILP